MTSAARYASVFLCVLLFGVQQKKSKQDIGFCEVCSYHPALFMKYYTLYAITGYHDDGDNGL